ncbi:hypothetical protein D3C73_1585110 [compost metagenome]
MPSFQGKMKDFALNMHISNGISVIHDHYHEQHLHHPMYNPLDPTYLEVQDNEEEYFYHFR